MPKKNKKSIAPGLRSKTLEIHGGGSKTDKELRPVLHRVVGFSLGSFERTKRLFAGEEEGFIYTRISNPTVDKLEKRLSSLEGAEAALATASGMAAVTLLAFHFANSGGHIVSSSRLYGGVFQLFRERLPVLGISVSFVENPYDEKAWQKTIRPNTKFLYVETPSNPMIEVFDISRLAKIAHQHDLPLVVDSTLATPVLLKPLQHGADIIIHSLSKYMGNGEVIGGAILGKKKLMGELRSGWLRDTGPCLSPDNAAIFCNHIESLFGRVQEHCRNTSLVAKYLSGHRKVKSVFYPEYGKYVKENKRLMPQGFGGLMAFEIKGGTREAKTVLESLKIFWHAGNIGEARSLVIHPATTTHGQMTPRELSEAGISQGMLRLSIGREDPQDLIDDLTQALEKI